jgi:hypothetical protein
MVRDQNPQHWKLLIFYYNPDNPRLFVPKRTGLPVTLNFARPMAWVMTAPIIALLAFGAIVKQQMTPVEFSGSTFSQVYIMTCAVLMQAFSVDSIP